MKAIFWKEIRSFFASAVGYLVIGLFLIINGLFLWVFNGEYNLLDYGYADLTPFFQLVPWIFIFLIPAITMRSFSEEMRQGTLELLLTRPISDLKIVLGKVFAAFALIVIALLPTLLYLWALNSLADASGSVDLGVVTGSYLGLLFLALAYTGIGVFASMLSANQIVSFLIAVGGCFLFYFGLEGLAELLPFSVLNDSLYYLSLNNHFSSISRGVIDTADLVYFLSFAAFFVFLTKLRLQLKRA